MRTVTFQSVYEAILRRHAMDPLGDAVTHDTARAIVEHVNDRVATAWASWDWAELTLTEERAYRQVWNDTTQYRLVSGTGLPDEVYYMPTQLYYQAGGTAPTDPLIAQPPTNALYWHVLDPVSAYVARDQAGMRPMGDVLGVYGSNPALCANGQSAGCLKFKPSEQGVTVCHGSAGTVFIQYRVPEPTYTFVPFIFGKHYAPGDRVFNTADGDCYRCIAVTTSQPPPDPLFWVLEPVPAIFGPYLKAGAYADCLKESAGTEDQVRLLRAKDIEAEAEANLEQAIDQLQAQGQVTWYDIFHSTLGNRQSAGCGGVCVTKPWTGNIVYPLTGAPSPLAFGRTPLPPVPGMIYRPEIVSVSTAGPSLKTFPTSSLAVDTLVVITLGDLEQRWLLGAGIADPGDPNQLSPGDYNVVNNNKHWTLVSIVGGASGESGITPLVSGQGYVDVTFAVAQANAQWIFIECRVVNTIDAAPLNIWPGIVTGKTETGFRLQLNGTPDTANYKLSWTIRESTTITGEATTYLLSGPVSGPISAPATFTVSLPVGSSVPVPVTIAPSASGGGTFSPTLVVLTTDAPSASFTYTPVSYGAKTISTTNDSGLTDPAPGIFTCVVSTYLLSGPGTGTVGTPSTPFTVQLPAGGAILGTMIVTPSAGAGGGTFTPSTVALTTAAPSATFTYTPATSGSKTISTTNNRGLTDPAGITCVVAGPLSDGNPVSTWVDSSGHGHDATMTGSNRPIYKTGIIGGKPVVRFTTAGASKLNLASNISGAGAFTVLAVFKANSGSVEQLTIASTDGTPYGPAEISGNLYGSNRANYFAQANDYSGAFHVITFGTDGAAAATLRIDSVPPSVPSPNALVGTGNFSSIGWRSTGPLYSDGDIAEIIFYNLLLAGTTIQNVEKYLGAKYGITLDPSNTGTPVQPDTVTGLQGWWKADTL